MTRERAVGALNDGRAEVRVRDVVMRYRRAGAGTRTVVLLVSDDDASCPWPELEPALAASFRVIVPELANAQGDVAGWLAAFLEGLGARDVAVVAADPWCIATVELVLLDVETVTRAVLVADGAAADSGLDGVVTSPVRACPVPLLILRRGLDAGDAVATVLRFVGQNGS